jgi:pimeloyl-ACP methyl ester carboxylesterase
MTRHFFSTVASAILLICVLMASQGCSKDETTVNPPPVDTTVTAKVRPIVFVHGYLEAADAWSPMSALFTLNGYTDAQVNAFDLEGCIAGNTLDVAKATDQLKTKVAAVLATTGSDRVDIVAHGMAAQAVQQFLVKQNGLASTAHVVFLGGNFDASQTVTGSLTPAPVKYLAFRSNGADATQGGDASKGTLQGADNRAVNGLDHQQLLASSDVFAQTFTFFNGGDATIKKLPATANLKGYALKFRVISMFDNTPVAGATVRFSPLKRGLAERQSSKKSELTSDAQGYISVIDTVNPTFDLEIYVYFKSAALQQQYQDMHIYRLSWRANSTCERLPVLPKTGGSAFVQALNQGIATSPLHTFVIVRAPYQALYAGRDQASVTAFDAKTPPDYYDQKTVSLLTNENAPPAGTSAQGSNTSYLFLFDMYSDRSDVPGPVPVAALNAYLINSYDIFLNATAVASNYGIVTLNSKTVAFRSYKSLATNQNTGGYNLVQFDYAE